MTDQYTDWLEENLGAWIRHELELEPRVVVSYRAAFQGDPVGMQWMAATPVPAAAGTAPAAAEPTPSEDAAEPELADLPFADVPDADLAEAVTGVLPEGTDPAVANEIASIAEVMAGGGGDAFASAEELSAAMARAEAALAGASDADEK